MKPIGKYIVAKDLAEEIKTQSGLVLSGDDANQFRYKKAVVIKPGTDVSTIGELDIIYYDKGHSFTMMINDEQFTILRESDVVVVV